MEKNNEVIVSIIMPVYNAEKYVKQAVDSILKQTLKNFEFIIVFEVGCNEKTKDIVKNYTDERIKVVYKKESEKGITMSLNIGIKLAVGKYIARMDADDISFSSRLEKQVCFLNNNPNIVMCGTGISKNNKVKWHGYQDTNNIKFCSYFENPFAHPTVMWRREKFIEANLFYKNVPSEDFELWKRVVNNFQVANLKKTLLMYRVHEKSISATNNNEMKKAVLVYNKRQFEDSGIIYDIKGEFFEAVSKKELEKREKMIIDLCHLWDDSYLIHKALEDVARVLYAENDELNFKRFWNEFSFVYTKHCWQKVRVYCFIMGHRIGRPLRILYVKVRRDRFSDYS